MDAILNRLRTDPRTRIVALGSSNTERLSEGLHWFDWLDLAIRQTYGRVHHCINAGLGGDTSRGLLARFERDVALYRPHVVLVTIGGNDAHPHSGIDDAGYAANLRQLAQQIRALGAAVIFQTYYSADIEAMLPAHGAAFLRYMALVRETAAATGAILIDHHRRWERLRLGDPAQYRRLMIDALHVNPAGNMLMGLDLARRFEAQLQGSQLAFCAEGLRLQRLLDELEEQAPKEKP